MTTQWLQTPETIENASNIQTKSPVHLNVREGKGVIIILKYTQDAQKYNISFPLLMISRPFDNSTVTVSVVVCDMYVSYTHMAQNTFLKEWLRNTKASPV